MCFSLQVDKDIQKLAKMFKAKPLAQEFVNLQRMQSYANKLEGHQLKNILGLKRKPQREVFKTPKEDGRIYPNYFTPIITLQKNNRIIRPMRYRVRPHNSSEEIPSKYNVFNARLDALEKRSTWKPLFMHQHGLVPFIKFYEWVEDSHHKKKLIIFTPENREIMWAPCLWDYWSSEDKKIHFYSFAIITDDPPPEIAAQGHDRCPIFLKHELIDQWLSPEGKSKKEIYSILKNIEETHYQHAWAA